jgi:hypothetical protein
MEKTSKHGKRIGEPDLREIAELHAQASKKLELLHEEYQSLLDAGEKAAARAALQRAEKLQTVLRALEAPMKQRPVS